MAVTVEEDLNKGGITIRLALNTGDLLQIVKEFNNIAEILEMAVLKSKIKPI